MQVFYRYYLYDSDTSAVSLRLHLFEDASETYIHNHRTNVMSVCLSGGYDHSVWRVVNTEPGTFRKVMRLENGAFADPEELPGRLVRLHTFPHLPGHIYFLGESSYHTVKVPDGAASSTLTIFVKDR